MTIAWIGAGMQGRTRYFEMDRIMWKIALAVVALIGVGLGAYLIYDLKGTPAPEETPPQTQASLFGEDATATETEEAQPPTTSLRFTDGAAEAGIDFVHEPNRSPQKLMPEIMASGVAIVDLNRDGAPDVVMMNSGDLLALERSTETRNRLFINDGQGRFTDQTDQWRLPSPGYGMGVAAGDFDNDGWTDLYITGYGGANRLLRNTGTHFDDVTESSGIGVDPKWSSSAGFLDMDHDGDLDLYVAYYVEYDVHNPQPCYRGDQLGYCTPVLFKGVRDRLFRNNGDGTFTDVTDEAGIPEDACNGLALGIGDVNDDGHADIYVANDVTRNFLLLGNGDGTFTEKGQLLGVAYSEQGHEEAGMGVDLTDVNADGLVDIACTNFQGQTTSIYTQGTGMFFRELSDRFGVGETARARLSFGIDFFDADNDGDEDLLVANGHIQDVISLYADNVSFDQPNTLYENVGPGRLVDVTEGAGPALQASAVSRGLATGDLDADGDLDFIVNNNGGPVQVGINATEPRGQFVNLWLEGVEANRTAIGAKIKARVGERVIERQVMGASSYLSTCDFRVHLGLGDATAIDELTIIWPGGEIQTFENIAAGSFYHVVQGEQPMAYVPGEKPILP